MKVKSAKRAPGSTRSRSAKSAAYALTLDNPRSISVEHLDPTTVSVRWKEPDATSPALVKAVAYKVRVSGDGGHTFPVSFLTATRSCEIGGLTPSHGYCVTVASTLRQEAEGGGGGGGGGDEGEHGEGGVGVASGEVTVEKRQTAVRFNTRPVPQTLGRAAVAALLPPPAASPGKKKPAEGPRRKPVESASEAVPCPGAGTRRQRSPFYSSIKMPGWLKQAGQL